MEERSKEDYTKYYDKIEIIGSGAFGYIYKGKEKGSRDKFRAIKVYDLDKIRENLLYEYDCQEIEEYINTLKIDFIQEYKNMKLCSKNNDNSVKCYEYFNNANNFVLIMELCDKNLSQLLNEKYKETEEGFSIKEFMK